MEFFMPLLLSPIIQCIPTTQWATMGNSTALTYEIKMSGNPLELRDATFHSAISVNTSGLTPAVAGTKEESHQFKPENFTKENGTTVYFAIRATDDRNNVGEASNVARAVLLMPTSPGAIESNGVIEPILITVITLGALALTICGITIVRVLTETKIWKF